MEDLKNLLEVGDDEEEEEEKGVGWVQGVGPKLGNT